MTRKWTGSQRSYFNLEDAQATVPEVVKVSPEILPALKGSDGALALLIRTLYDTFPNAIRKSFGYDFIKTKSDEWVANHARKIFGGKDELKTQEQQLPAMRAPDATDDGGGEEA